MTVSLGNGSDVYYFSGDGEEIRAGNGADVITVDGYFNSVFGENGNDTLTANGAGNLLDGGRGDDRLNSVSYYGGSTLTGGQGADIFSVNNVGDNIVANNNGSTKK
ncbi:calcium-binding protein [Paracraurococcus ruber]|uniref:hypothetical protein n=1 Tax=Paracraurococcus ruber TaxID=77675 RepID=UPI001057E3F0|nr:hypothetical protein [Paracraurococcus ruber]TDG18666.1 hypothetical protein E2C05_27970 [Paracraurococcus ruber]